MTNNKNDIVRQKYNEYIYNQTLKYQKKYGFEIGNGEHAAWNNESDAFKHTFMSADMALKIIMGFSKYKGDQHEIEGRTKMGQSAGEENMDRWNNAEGRKIAQKIQNEIRNPFVLKKYAWNGRLEDMIAEEVMIKMRKGDLIKHPSDPRKYVEHKKDTRTPGQKFDVMIRSDYHRLKKKAQNKILRKSRSNNISSSGNGHWVTIKGAHVFIEN